MSNEQHCRRKDDSKPIVTEKRRIVRYAFTLDSGEKVVSVTICGQCIKIVQANSLLVRLMVYDSITVNESEPCINCSKSILSI